VLSLTIKGQRELQDLAHDLRRGKGTLRSELTKAFKTAGAATLKQVKRNVETMQIRGRRKGGRAFRDQMPGNNLRRRISRITELDISTSTVDPRVRFIVRNEQLADIKAEQVPWHLDTGKPFRHPIMGNRSAWAASVGKPWFYDEIRKDQAVFVAECDKAINRTIDKIEKG
jgi:hypothetical protein